MPNGHEPSVIFIQCDKDLKIAIKVDAARKQQSIREWIQDAAREALSKDAATQKRAGV